MSKYLGTLGYVFIPLFPFTSAQCLWENIAELKKEIEQIQEYSQFFDGLFGGGN